MPTARTPAGRRRKRLRRASDAVESDGDDGGHQAKQSNYGGSQRLRADSNDDCISRGYEPKCNACVETMACGGKRRKTAVCDQPWQLVGDGGGAAETPVLTNPHTGRSSRSLTRSSSGRASSSPKRSRRERPMAQETPEIDTTSEDLVYLRAELNRRAGIITSQRATIARLETENSRLKAAVIDKPRKRRRSQPPPPPIPVSVLGTMPVPCTAQSLATVVGSESAAAARLVSSFSVSDSVAAKLAKRRFVRGAFGDRHMRSKYVQVATAAATHAVAALSPSLAERVSVGVSIDDDVSQTNSTESETPIGSELVRTVVDSFVCERGDTTDRSRSKGRWNEDAVRLLSIVADITGISRAHRGRQTCVWAVWA